MEYLPPDAVLVAPNRGREELASTPAFLHARAARHRHLAAKVRRETNAMTGDPIAPRLIELAEKLEADALHDEEEATALSVD